MVVLPAPVGPTMATFWPALTLKEKSWMTSFSGEYPKDTFRNSTSPFTSVWTSFLPSSFSISGLLEELEHPFGGGGHGLQAASSPAPTASAAG